MPIPSKNKLELSDLAPLIHQAALNPLLDQEKLYQICDSARGFNFSGLCTNLNQLPLARNRLGSSGPTKLIAPIAFPFGTIPSFLKKVEAEWAASEGADELDVVPNFSALSQKQAEVFGEELASICAVGLPVRVILNMSQLNPEELSLAIDAALDAGVSGIQNGNGFGPPVTTKDIHDLVELVHGRCSIKAVGGLKTLQHALEIVKAGATLIGTSSGIDLVQKLRRD